MIKTAVFSLFKKKKQLKPFLIVIYSKAEKLNCINCINCLTYLTPHIWHIWLFNYAH